MPNHRYLYDISQSTLHDAKEILGVSSTYFQLVGVTSQIANFWGGTKDFQAKSLLVSRSKMKGSRNSVVQDTPLIETH